MFAAILTCGMAMVSCAVEDLPVDPADQPVVTVLDLEDEDALNAFVIADAAKMTASIVDDEATQSKALQLVRGGSSGIGFAAYQFPDMENATEVEISFDVNIKAAIQGTSGITIGDASVHNTTFGGFTAGQWGYGSNGAIFYFGGGRGRIVPGNNTNFDYFQINGVCKAAPDADAVKGVAEPTWDRFTTDVWNTWLTVNVVVNVAEKTYSYSIANGEEVYWAEENLPFVSEGAETCTQLDFHSGNAATVLFKNISVSKKKMDASIKYADYTIQFIDTEGNPIPEDLKVPVVRRGKVGTEITLLDSDKANMQTADGATKYIYQSDNSEGATITEDGTVINVVFKAEAVPTYKYILNGMIDGVPGLDGRLFIFQGEEFVGKVTTFYLPIGCGKDGAYYFVTPKTYNGYDVSFNGSEETTAGYVLQTVNYVLDPNVVYFADCEDMDDFRELKAQKKRIKEALVQFPTPSDKDDLLDFMLYLKPKIQHSEHSDAFLMKYNECVEKVEILYPEDPDFEKIIGSKVKKNNWGKFRGNMKKTGMVMGGIGRVVWVILKIAGILLIIAIVLFIVLMILGSLS